MEDSHSHHCHCFSSKENPRNVHFTSSFLELGNQMGTQSNRPWPLAHLTDALGQLHPPKQNVLVQEGGSFEKEQDLFRKGIAPSSVGRKFMSSLLTETNNSESRENLHEEKPSIQIVGDTREFVKWSSSSSELKGIEYQDVTRKGVDKHVIQEMERIVYGLSDASSTAHKQAEILSTRSMLNIVKIKGQRGAGQADKVLLLGGVSSSKGHRKETQNIKRTAHTQLWEYALTSEPVLSVLSGKIPSSPDSSSDLHRGQSVRPTKCTHRKIPVQLSEKYTPATVKTLKIVGLRKANDKLVYKRKAAQENGKHNVQTVRVLKQLLCGGFAGVVSRTLVAPLDLIKTYLITSHGVRGSKKSALTICKEIVGHDGWQGLFRGNLVNCLRVAPSKAIELCVFETVRRALNRDGHPLRHAAATIAGGAAGMAGTIATYPLELLRTRLSVQPELYSSLSQAIKKIAQEEGLSAFYSGLSPSLVGVFPYAATNYFVYDGLRTAYCRSTGEKTVPTIPTLLFGAVAASASSAVTYPLEVARRQMQLSFPASVVNRSTVGLIVDIYQHEGIMALYRGLGTTWLKLIPAAGISFVCYEAARLALQIDDASLVKKKPEETILAEQEPP